MLEIRWHATRVGARSLSDGYSLFGALLCHMGFMRHAEPNTQVLLMDSELIVRADPAKARAMECHLPSEIPVGSGSIRLRKARIALPEPRSELHARIVTIKGKTCDQSMLKACRRQLKLIGVDGRITVGKRACVVVAAARIVGYQVSVRDLSPRKSISLINHGLGGKQRMGCGVFV